MQKRTENRQTTKAASEERDEFRVEDRRHWAREDEDPEEGGVGEAEVKQPTLIDEYRQRTEAAEQKLQEYIEAFKRFKDEQEEYRLRLARDVDRRVELQFGEMVGELLESMDNLDLAISHVNGVPEAEPMIEGVEMARKRFLDTLEQHGVEKISPEGALFDPNYSEAVRVDHVDSPDDDGKVTETIRPGYRLGERVIRPARVAVGRFTPKS
jgi:molecular chaperone GrpE (heat shock protein)